ncbi:uncharacterized protein KD926_010022 [Aspergillus affinis]|uniref:uncharacterized protein n=1 Tax=Aspergillus affinis TaxID=1070780 RepID=UPI0022FF1062|nr:uncharacterized protein KD926_010022 [Aspergillus affinis]KAI9039038.1 hypothetical protein KD926_010022 [Aspergillus affinis]
MVIFSWLCCIPPSPSPPPLSASSQPHPHSTTTTTNATNHASGEEIGYTSPPDLPAYTPRRDSIHEKTLEFHMRDPSISSASASFDQNQQSQHSDYPDEKAHYQYDQDPSLNSPLRNSNRPEDLSSDVSSAISFTSSYGNTSTATRETPPPPYSPREGSPVPGRSRSVSSVSGRGMGWAVGVPTQMMQIAQPRPVFQRRETLMRSFVARRR